jgi:hypothetical protein
MLDVFYKKQELGAWWTEHEGQQSGLHCPFDAGIELV